MDDILEARQKIASGVQPTGTPEQQAVQRQEQEKIDEAKNLELQHEEEQQRLQKQQEEQHQLDLQLQQEQQQLLQQQQKQN